MYYLAFAVIALLFSGYVLKIVRAVVLEEKKCLKLIYRINADIQSLYNLGLGHGGKFKHVEQEKLNAYHKRFCAYYQQLDEVRMPYMTKYRLQRAEELTHHHDRIQTVLMHICAVLEGVYKC